MVPNDWRVLQLGQVFAERDERGRPDLELMAVTSEQGVVRRDSLDRRDTSNSDKSKYKVVYPGDIAYNTMRMWQGVSGLVPEIGIVSPAYTVITPSGLHDRYAAYLLKLPALVRKFRAHSQGIVDDTLSLKYPAFARLQVAVPPLDEQRRIAAVLQAADAAVAAAQAVIDQTETVKRGLVEQLLTRGMPGRHTRFKMTDIGEVPESWQVLSLRQCISEGPQYGANAAKAPYVEGKPRFVRITDINADGTLSADRAGIDEEVAAPFILRDGDVVLARSGATVGKSYRYKPADGLCAFAGYLIRVRPDPERLSAGYLEEYLSSSRYWAWVAGNQRAGAQPNINGQEYCEMRLPIPTVKEQEQIAAALQTFRDQKAIAERTLEALRSVSNGLSADLLSGRVRVPA